MNGIAATDRNDRTLVQVVSTQVSALGETLTSVMGLKLEATPTGCLMIQRGVERVVDPGD